MTAPACPMHTAGDDVNPHAGEAIVAAERAQLDAIVVGAGLAGLVAAAELTSRGRRVVVVVVDARVRLVATLTSTSSPRARTTSARVPL